MRSATCLTTVVLSLAAATLCATPLSAQSPPANAGAAKTPADAPAPPPPELQRLIELAKDPERLRQVMSDPNQIQQIMAAMESDAVRQYMSEPGRMQQLMRDIDPQTIQEAMRAVDFNKVREAAVMRWKARLKQQLGVTEEEWKALEPRIDAVVAARRDTAPPARGGRGGPGGMGGPGGFGLARSVGSPGTELEFAL